MTPRKLGGVLSLASVLVFCVPPTFAGAESKGSALPSIGLTTHDNKTVRFYDELVRGKVVLVNFMFTSCKRFCPATTPNLVRVQAALGDRVGRDIFMYSITLDPATDTPEVLTDYGPGVSTSWSETTRFERKCHSLSVSRERVFGERRRAPGARAAGDAAPGGEAHGSGSCRHGGPPRTGPG